MDGYKITKRDILALRKATGVSFHTTDDGTFVRAYFERGSVLDEQVIWTAYQQRMFPDSGPFTNSRMRHVPASVSLRSFNERSPDRFTAYESVTSSARDQVWQTIVASLREGDHLVLCWTRNNDNEYYRKVGYHRDELRLRVVRDGKQQRVFEFLVEVSVGPDNTARMVRAG